MKIRKLCKGMAAWILTLSMVVSNGAFVAQAGDLSDAEPVVVAETEVSPEADVVEPEDVSDAGTVEVNEAEEPAPAEVEEPAAPAAEEPELFGDGVEDPFVSGEEEELLSDGETDPSAGEGEEIRIGWGDQFGYDLPEEMDWSWIFPDTTYTLYLEGQPEGSSVTWELEGYTVQNGEPVPIENTFIEIVSSDGPTCVLKGLSADPSIAQYVIATATVKNSEGEEIAAPQMQVIIRMPYEEYSYDPANDDRTMLIDESRGIGTGVYYNVMNPDHWGGFNTEIPFTKVEVAQYTYGENGEEIPVESGVMELNRNEDGYWWIYALGYGHAVVTVTHPSTEDPNSELKSESFDYYVGGDRYALDTAYPVTGNDWMRPGEEMVISTSMHHFWYRSEEERGDEPVANYRLEVTSEDWGPFEAAVDGKNIVLKAGSDSDYYIIVNVKAIALDADGNPTGAEATTSFGVGSANEYDALVVKDDEIENMRALPVGGSVEIHPAFVTVNQDGETPVDPKEYTYRWEWDDHVLKITDASQKVLTQEDKTGTAPFTVTRLSNDQTDAWLAVDRTDDFGNVYEARSLCLTVDGIDIDTQLNTADDRYNEYRDTWMYTNENVTLTLDTEKFRDMNYEIVWRLGPTDDQGEFVSEIPAEGGYYKADNTSITLYGEKLAELFGEGTVYSEEYGGFGIRPQLKVDDVLVGDCGWIWVSVREPYYDYQWPDEDPGARNRFPGEDYFIWDTINGYVEDGAHPYGENVELKITDVKLMHNWVWNDETQQDEEYPEDLMEVTREEDGWSLHMGETYGRSEFDLVCESMEPGEETHTYSSESTDPEGNPGYFDVNVVYEDWYLSWIYPDADEDMMLPETTKTVDSSLVHAYPDDNGEYQYDDVKDYRLYVTWEDGEPTYNTDWATVEVVDNTRIKVTAKDEDHAWFDRIAVRVAVPNEEGEYDFVDDSNLYINVTPEYDAIFPLELTTPEGNSFNVDKGQELDLNAFDLQMRHSSLNPEENGKILSGENYRIRFRDGEDGYDSNSWSIKAGTEDQMLPVLVRNGENAEMGTGVSLIGERRVLDDNGNPVKDEQGNEIWEELAGRYFWFDGLCEEHTWTTITKEATADSPKVVITRCEVCGVETRETIGPMPLEKVELVKAASAAYNKIKVTWKPADGADGYRIYRKAAGQKKWELIKTVGASSTSFADSTVAYRTKYTYTVRAYRGEGASLELGGYNKTGKSAKAHMGVVTLKKASASSNGIQVTWKKKAGATGYIVLRKTAGSKWQRVGVVSSSATSFTDKKVTAGTEYTYTVRAYRTVNNKNLKAHYNQKGVSAKAV